MWSIFYYNFPQKTKTCHSSPMKTRYGVGCLLWVLALIDICVCVFCFSHSCAVCNNHYIGPCYNGTRLCLWYKNAVVPVLKIRWSHGLTIRILTSRKIVTIILVIEIPVLKIRWSYDCFNFTIITYPREDGNHFSSFKTSYLKDKMVSQLFHL